MFISPDRPTVHRSSSLPWTLTALLNLLIATSPAFAAELQEPTPHVQSYIRTHCVKCHGPDKSKAELRLDQLIGSSELSSAKTWHRVFEVLHQGEMPPDSEKEPTGEDTRRVLSWMKGYFASAREIAGSGGFRRLNRREISNSVNDLLGLNVDYTKLLPPDGLKEDFDNRAEALRMSDPLLENHLEVTQRIVDSIHILGSPPNRKERYFDFADLYNNLKKATQSPELRRISKKYFRQEGLRIHPIQPLFADSLSRAVRGGKYAGTHIALDEFGRKGLVRVEVSFYAEPKESEHVPRLIVFLNSREVSNYAVTGTPEHPQQAVIDYYLEGLPKLTNQEGAPLLGIGFSNVYPEEGGKGEGGNEYKDGTSVFVQSVKISGGLQVERPLLEGGDPDQQLSPDREEALVREYLTRFLSQAFRRPVSDVDVWFRRYQSFREGGISVSESLKACMQVALSSPGFLYLTPPEGLSEEAQQYAIASRLSYFLWSTGPDEKLLELASRKELLTPAVLDRQIERMLQHPYAHRFYRNFALRWTGLRGLDIQFDSKDIWHRTQRYLEESMKGEAVAYFREIVGQNIGAVQLLDSDFAMVNDVMAAYLGYEGKFDASFRRVHLDPSDPRGGLLGQAGIMALTGNGKPPITRGVWMLRKILDDPPPDPPLDVPELNSKDPELLKKPFREQLRAHQEDPDCAICHRKIDPLGFAFEHFDPVGRWQEMGKRGKETVAIDTAGHMPRGEEFQTFDEMKEALKSGYRDDFARGLTTNLLAYAVGRELTPEDLEDVNEVVERLKPDGFPMKEMIKAVVQTETFLNR